MKYLTSLIISFLASEIIYAQTPSKIWHFGTNTGIDFNYYPPRKINNGNHSFHEGGVTLTDESGYVLFYVDEYTVYNRNNFPMKNGIGLIGNTGPSAQSPIALQELVNPELVYIFYVADHFDNSIIGQLRYSIIDICGDNGQGKVLSNKKYIRVPGQFTERLTAAYDAVNNRYWILTSDYNTQNVKAFELTESGLNTVAVTSYMADSSRPSYIGMISFNHQKNKIAYTFGLLGDFRGIILADFDMKTGGLSNPMKIHYGDIYDVVFSPKGKYLYATDIFAGCVLYKFDLLNRSNDKVLFEKGGNYAFNAIEEGPDGKIYLAIESDNSIGQIAKPDLENEEFNATFLQYSHPTKVGAGLQSMLDSGLDQTKWSDGSLGRNLIVTKAGKYYYYFRDCGILYTDTINIQYEEQINRIEDFNDAFCNGDSLLLTTDRNDAIWNNGEISDKIIVRKEGLYFASFLDGCYMEIKRYDIKIDTFLPSPHQGDTFYCNSSSLSINISEPFKLFDDQRNEIEYINNPSLNGNYFIIGQNSCGLIEKPFKIAVDTFPDLPKDSLIVCTLQEFPLLVKTNVSSTIWDNAYISKQFTINEPGIYSYYLNNSCGQFSSKINVLMSNIKVLPNIFSPNGAGINDYFPGLNFSVYFSLSVFDRWGNLIFEGNDDWDGNYKGNHTES